MGAAASTGLPFLSFLVLFSFFATPLTDCGENIPPRSRLKDDRPSGRLSSRPCFGFSARCGFTRMGDPLVGAGISIKIPDRWQSITIGCQLIGSPVQC